MSHFPLAIHKDSNLCVTFDNFCLFFILGLLEGLSGTSLMRRRCFVLQGRGCDRILCSPGWPPPACYVDKASLELLILLPSPPEPPHAWLLSHGHFHYIPIIFSVQDCSCFSLVIISLSCLFGSSASSLIICVCVHGSEGGCRGQCWFPRSWSYRWCEPPAVAAGNWGPVRRAGWVLDRWALARCLLSLSVLVILFSSPPPCLCIASSSDVSCWMHSVRYLEFGAFHLARVSSPPVEARVLLSPLPGKIPVCVSCLHIIVPSVGWVISTFHCYEKTICANAVWIYSFGWRAFTISGMTAESDSN